jgi:hypothetical protein
MTDSRLSQDKVREFQRLVFEECGVEMPFEIAWKRASQLIALYRMLMAPIPEDPEAAMPDQSSNLDHLA